MYKLEFSKKAVKSLKGIAPQYQKRIIDKLKTLSKNPYKNTNVKALKGEDNLYRLRVADYRVIYTIENNELIILIIDINHRKNVYKK